jgi:hypothetical protein
MTEHHQRGKRENTISDKPKGQPIAEKPGVKIEIHAAAKGEWKALGGSDRDQWNERLSDLVIRALPVNQTNAAAVSHAGSAVAAGIVEASRTVAMLTERLDHHRNQGKQQIVVQHTTTVNANQAVVTDSVVTGKKNEAASSAKLVAAVTDKPMEIIEAEKHKEAVPVGGRDTKAK